MYILEEWTVNIPLLEVIIQNEIRSNLELSIVVIDLAAGHFFSRIRWVEASEVLLDHKHIEWVKFLTYPRPVDSSWVSPAWRGVRASVSLRILVRREHQDLSKIAHLLQKVVDKQLVSDL